MVTHLSMFALWLDSAATFCAVWKPVECLKLMWIVGGDLKLKSLFWVVGNFVVGLLIVGFCSVEALNNAENDPERLSTIQTTIFVLAFPVGWVICLLIDKRKAIFKILFNVDNWM